MTKSITQVNQNDNQISASIRKFFKRFHLSSALKAANAYKVKGFSVIEIYQYLFLLIFSNRSMYMNMLTGRNTPSFAKDTVYSFMKMVHTNWIRFTSVLCSRIIRDAILPLNAEKRVNVHILMTPCMSEIALRRWNFLQKYMTTQNMHIDFAFVCWHLVGRTEALFYQLIAFF